MAKLHFTGEMIRVARGQRALTQSELGHLVGCSRQHINAIEHGLTPHPNLLKKLAEVLLKDSTPPAAPARPPEQPARSMHPTHHEIFRQVTAIQEGMRELKSILAALPGRKRGNGNT